MYQSNYNWGYMRNEIEWGIATWGENAQADANLQYGLITRWQNNSVPHFLARRPGRRDAGRQRLRLGARASTRPSPSVRRPCSGAT